MGDPVTLREEDVSRIGEYVKPWLREVAEQLVEKNRQPTEYAGVGPQLLERRSGLKKNSEINGN